MTAERNNPWPHPPYTPEPSPHILFILTPPCSGSTVLAQWLNSTPRATTLTPHAEGQWLIPGLCGEDRWDPDLVVDYESVKAVWLHTFQKSRRWTRRPDLLIEKSPPNMLRILELSALFPRVSHLVNNRNPFAQCASVLGRVFPREKTPGPRRQEILGHLVRAWIGWSQRLRNLVLSQGMPLLTYEQFCQTPERAVEVLDLHQELKSSIQGRRKVRIKDYAPQPIINQNPRQAATLYPEERIQLAAALKPHAELLAFFGYPPGEQDVG